MLKDRTNKNTKKVLKHRYKVEYMCARIIQYRVHV